MRPIFVFYKTKGKEPEIFTFFNWSHVHAALFNPNIEEEFVTDFTIRGKTYSERKDNARYLAMTVMDNLREVSYSWNEYALITDELCRIAKNNGLIREFKENAII